jgi:hypothetical protein
MSGYRKCQDTETDGIRLVVCFALQAPKLAGIIVAGTVIHG